MNFVAPFVAQNLQDWIVKKTLTPKHIASLAAAPKGKRYDVMDSIVPGFVSGLPAIVASRISC